MARRVSSPVLVGGAAEAAQLRAALERAAAGQPLIVVVAGEAGIGKTRLVTELLERVRADKGLELARVLGGARAELARLVPELAAQATERQAEAPLAPMRLFELVLGVLHRLAERAVVLVVVEDLHWADQSTRDLVGFLVRNLRGGWRWW